MCTAARLPTVSNSHKRLPVGLYLTTYFLFFFGIQFIVPRPVSCRHYRMEVIVWKNYVKSPSEEPKGCGGGRARRDAGERAGLGYGKLVGGAWLVCIGVIRGCMRQL